MQGVTGTVVSAGAWPLIRAGVIAKHPAPADHLEAFPSFTRVSERTAPAELGELREMKLCK